MELQTVVIGYADGSTMSVVVENEAQERALEDFRQATPFQSAVFT